MYYSAVNFWFFREDIISILAVQRESGAAAPSLLPSTDEVKLVKAIENESFSAARKLLERGVKFVDAEDPIFFRLYENRKFASLCFLFENNLCGTLSPMKMQAVWVAACALQIDTLAHALLSQGLDPTLPSLLASAIFYERKGLIHVLISNGASLDDPKNPPFHECISGKMALWLIQTYAADPFVKNHSGKVLCQDKSLVKKDIVALFGFEGSFKSFTLSEADFEALKVHHERTPCNLLNLAFLLGNAPFVQELKARYPGQFTPWIEELKKTYSERSLTGLNQLLN